jgi:hypothetical protein
MKPLTRTLALAAALLLTAGGALAQMGGNSGGGSMPGGPWMQPIVAADGTVLIVRPAAAADPDATGMELVALGATGSTLWTWTADAGIHDLVVASGLVVVTSGAGGGSGPLMGGATSSATTTVTALRLASGAEAWHLDVDGVAMGLAADSARVYVTVVDPGAATSSGGSGTGSGSAGMGHVRGRTGGTPSASYGPLRGVSLAAIDLSGNVLWTVPLTSS